MKKIYKLFRKTDNINSEKDDKNLDYQIIIKKLKEDLKDIDSNNNSNNNNLSMVTNNEEKIDRKNLDIDIDINIEQQKIFIAEENIKKRKEWLEHMENSMSISPNDSIIFLKLLVSEAFRRNPIIKEKYKETCKNIFKNNSDPEIIKTMILKLELFAENKDIYILET